jgi:hypothetical protein
MIETARNFMHTHRRSGSLVVAPNRMDVHAVVSASGSRSGGRDADSCRPVGHCCWCGAQFVRSAKRMLANRRS